MNGVRLKHEVKAWLGLLALFLIGQVGVSLLYGLPFSAVLAPDSGRYLNGAIESGTLPYSGYIGLVQGVAMVGPMPTSIVCVQSALALIAGRMLLALGVNLGSRAAGVVAAAFYLTYPDLAQWTRYVLTEAAFYSVTIFVLSLAVLHVRRSILGSLAILAVAIAGASLRPNGFILVGALLSFWLILKLSKRIAAIAIGTGWALLVVLLIRSGYLATHDSGTFTRRLLQGQVFWNRDDFGITMPQTPAGVEHSATSLVSHVLSVPIEVISVFGLRIFWEIAQVRPWYSLSHNLMIVAVMSLFYVLASVGWWTTRGSRLNTMVWCVSIPSLLMIGATWAIHEGRFGWWFLVTWLPWVGFGATTVAEVIRHRVGTPSRIETSFRP